MNEKKASLESLEVSHNIVIGQGVTFVGSISARGKAFINGMVSGEISADDLHVGTSVGLSKEKSSLAKWISMAKFMKMFHVQSMCLFIRPD